jgi:hypothetical protein
MGAAVLHAYPGERNRPLESVRAGTEESTGEKSQPEKTKNQPDGRPLQEASGNLPQVRLRELGGKLGEFGVAIEKGKLRVQL